LKQADERWRRHGRGPCVICGDKAMWGTWLRVGAKDFYGLVCEPHRREYERRPDERRA